MNSVDTVLLVSWAVLLLIMVSPLAQTKRGEAIPLFAMLTVLVAVLGLAMDSSLLLLSALLSAVATVSTGVRGISADRRNGLEDEQDDEHRTV